MSHVNSNQNQWVLWIILALGCLLLFSCVRGCPNVGPPKPPALTVQQLLPGVWRSQQEGFDIAWTFTADGGLRWQLQPKNSVMALLGGGFDVKGRWRLDDDVLTMELSETPPQIHLFGGSWEGEKQTARIKRRFNEIFQ